MSGPQNSHTRQFLKTAAAGAAWMAFAPAHAQGGPREGVEYRVVQPTQQTDSGAKLEVLEFFWYGCPHCFSLEAGGKASALDEKVFTALHVDRISLDKPDRKADFLAKQGIDRKAFLDTYDSFAVRTRKQKATQQARAWGLDGVPALAVNGKYFTAPSMAKGNAQSLQVVEYLLDRERKARK